jgi:hypothetical protein
MATKQEIRQKNIVESYSSRRESLLTNLLRALAGLWSSFDDWYDDDMVKARAARSATLVETSMDEQRRLARSFATQMLRNLNAAPYSVPPQRDVYERSGSNIIEVYSRPAEQFRYARSIELDRPTALDRALKRVADLAETDLSLAERDETQRIYASSPKVIGRRRIIHPELSKTGTCGLCVVAADRLYYVDELMAIHDRCKCTDAPVTADLDPGQSLNREDLERLYDAAGSTAGADLKRLRVTVQQHGELGPILRQSGHDFKDADEVNKAAGRKRYKAFDRMTPEEQRNSWTAIIASSERSVTTLEQARAADSPTVDIGGTGYQTRVKNYDEAIKYHRDLIRRYRAKLAA